MFRSWRNWRAQAFSKDTQKNTMRNRLMSQHSLNPEVLPVTPEDAESGTVVKKKNPSQKQSRSVEGNHPSVAGSAEPLSQVKFCDFG